MMEVHVLIPYRDCVANEGASNRSSVTRQAHSQVAGTREPGAQTQTLEEIMSTILRNAWQGEGTAAGSGKVWRDDVSVRSARYATRWGEPGAQTGSAALAQLMAAVLQSVRGRADTASTVR
jgi:hypothetical protein